MDSTFIEWLIGQAGTAGLAAMSLYLLNRSHEDANRREREYAEAHRADKLELIRIITELSRSLSALEKAIQSIEEHRERERSRERKQRQDDDGDDPRRRQEP